MAIYKQKFPTNSKSYFDHHDCCRDNNALLDQMRKYTTTSNGLKLFTDGNLYASIISTKKNRNTRSLAKQRRKMISQSIVENEEILQKSKLLLNFIPLLHYA